MTPQPISKETADSIRAALWIIAWILATMLFWPIGLVWALAYLYLNKGN